MVVCNSLADLPKINQSVLTIGSFDGIHRGHIEILKQIKILASSTTSKSALITFTPHPKAVLRPDLVESRHIITTLEKKHEIFKMHGIDYMLILPFDQTLARIEADVFLKDIIIRKFNPHDIVVGYDHQFGYNRQGNIDLLNYYAESKSYNVHKINQMSVNGVPISSSRIRNDLKSGRIKQANKLLGWSYEIKGTVQKGDGLGKKIGYPTANIEPIDDCQIIPSNGVYNVDIIIKDQVYNGMCNIGCRPTVSGKNNRIEVNIFSNDDLDLYSKEIKVIFKEYLRDEKKFSSIDKLRLQLDKDKKCCLKLNRKIKGVEHVNNKRTC